MQDRSNDRSNDQSDGQGGGFGRKPRRVGREIALSLTFAAVFGVGLGVYIWRSMPVLIGPQLVDAGAGSLGAPDDLAIAEAFVQSFIGHVAAGRMPAAYSQMARGYRETASLAAFTRVWTTSPLLVGAHAVRLVSTTRGITAALAGERHALAVSSARGHLLTRAGALDVGFTFLDEEGQRRILALFVGGVPVLQGVAIPGSVP